jgi:hypothetical protein
MEWHVKCLYFKEDQMGNKKIMREEKFSYKVFFVKMPLPMQMGVALGIWRRYRDMVFWWGNLYRC